jgi:hypothetical protein
MAVLIMLVYMPKPKNYSITWDFMIFGVALGIVGIPALLMLLDNRRG